jgi:hypothetical protein
MGEPNPNSIHIQEGPGAGRIADPNVAQEIANLEKPARDLELGLERQAQIGLNPEQEKNVELMKGLEEKYPKAFQHAVDSKGRKILFTEVRGQPAGVLGSGSLLISQEGIYGLSTTSWGSSFELNDLNLTATLDAVANRQDEFKTAQGGWLGFKKDSVLTESGVAKVRGDQPNEPIRHIDISLPSLRGALKENFEARQMDATLAEERQNQFALQNTAEAILKDL